MLPLKLSCTPTPDEQRSFVPLRCPADCEMAYLPTYLPSYLTYLPTPILPHSSPPSCSHAFPQNLLGVYFGAFTPSTFDSPCSPNRSPSCPPSFRVDIHNLPLPLNKALLVRVAVPHKALQTSLTAFIGILLQCALPPATSLLTHPDAPHAGRCAPQAKRDNQPSCSHTFPARTPPQSICHHQLPYSPRCSSSRSRCPTSEEGKSAFLLPHLPSAHTPTEHLSPPAPLLTQILLIQVAVPHKALQTSLNERGAIAPQRQNRMVQRDLWKKVNSVVSV